MGAEEGYNIYIGKRRKGFTQSLLAARDLVSASLVPNASIFNGWMYR